MDYPVLNHHTRADELRKLATKEATFDAVIIGGGIVGAGLARELSIRGKKCLLVEKSDFASGTSSRSSKLIHGGLRYLEMLDFGLVFEALAERHWLLQSHPHLVSPLEFNLPIYSKNDRPPGARSSAALGLGLWLYDGLSLFRTPFFHGRRKPQELKGLFPKIREQGLKGSYFYADAMMLDDEVVLETIVDSVRRGCVALNYVEALGVSARRADELFEVRLKDALPVVQTRPGSAPLLCGVKAKEVIVCVGPWTERFGAHVIEGPARKLKPSKGVHLIVPWQRFPIERCLVMYAPDGRIIFAIPRKDLGAGAEMVIIGTTDSPAAHENLDTIHANRSDVEYLLKVMKEYFPQAQLAGKDIVMTYAGVRPLLDTGEQSEAKTSREHEIWRNKAGVVFMAGGKYTTFRKISQELADFSFPRSQTSKFEAESKTQLSTPEDYAKRLGGRPVWGRYTDDWIRWKIEHNMACTLEDIVFRRVPMWMAGRAIDDKLLDQVVEIAKPSFNWSEADIIREKAQVRETLSRSVRSLV